MNEALLQFIWKFRLFNQHELKTVQGESISIVHQGVQNTHAGPDFTEARIKAGNLLWAGNVELHVASNDWFKHRHDADKAYDNVIMHAVYHYDGKPVHRSGGAEVPVLELKGRINPLTLARYNEMAHRKSRIACQPFFEKVNTEFIKPYLVRLAVERLEDKVSRIEEMLTESGGDWENVMFRLVARYFGAGVNKEAFEALAKSLPVKIWARHVHEPLQVEALLFGQAGLLETDFEDEYPRQLRKEYLYLKRLHQLEPLPAHFWKLLRLRPSNFPTVRIAQLAALLCKETNVFSTVLNTADVKGLHTYFEADVNPYWKTHYLFDKPAKNGRTHVGDATKNTLLINAVAPVWFAYGKHKNLEPFCDKAVLLLESCPPESNAVINYWKGLGIKPANAFETQALLQLRTCHCDKFKCLECAIGLQVLK